MPFLGGGYFATFPLNYCYFHWSPWAPMGRAWHRGTAQSCGAWMYWPRWAVLRWDEGRKSPPKHLRKLSWAWFSERNAQSNPNAIIVQCSESIWKIASYIVEWDLELAVFRNFTVPAVTIKKKPTKLTHKSGRARGTLLGQAFFSDTCPVFLDNCFLLRLNHHVGHNKSYNIRWTFG